jgi:prepilin-type N-terminal cleavage/methylation domain-containing protein
MIDFKNKFGFTLLELLIAISIFAILTSLVGISYRSNEKLRQLKDQSQIIVDGLQKAQNMALTGEAVTIDGDLVVPSSYIFNLNSCTNNCFYTVTAAGTSGSVELSKVELKNLSANTNLQAQFTPPRGKMALNGNQTEVKLQISNSVGDDFCIKVNSISGRMDIASDECH